MPVRFSHEGDVARVTLSNPARRNAISRPMLEALHAALDRAEQSKAPVLLLESEGRSFCAGDDLDEFSATAPDEATARTFVDLLQGVTRRLMLGQAFTICAVQGHAVGGGAAWPVNADLCLVSDDASLFCPEAGFGLFPSGGMSFLLAECAGPKAATELLALGTRIDAERMVALGIATRVVPADRLADEAMRTAVAVAQQAQTSIRLLRAARQDVIRSRLEQALALEGEACVRASLDPGVRDRLAAFVRADG